jgi:Fe-S cluster biogenesis protein NfuA
MPSFEEVQKVLEDQIAPRLAMDGGGIELVEITDEGVVKVKLQGACQGCPGARMTLQMGVERILKEAFDDIESVEGV